ncbi:MAG: DUF4093 domain-containing protein [Oscillospiraceae bacterium]|nr:DUF4093 domain-containing protein [Oscillospiraceae bacterium]
MKLRIREVIVVEGRYDKNTLSQIVDAVIIETRGFGVFSGTEIVEHIRVLGKESGVILLTDSDGAGFVIRGKLAGMLHGVEIKHAYIPDIPGRERRKSRPGRAGLLGVEGMRREAILTALRGCGATFEDEKTDAPRGKAITAADLYSLGLSGVAGAAKLRGAVLEKLGLPRLLKGRGLLAALRRLTTLEELEEILRKL